MRASSALRSRCALTGVPGGRLSESTGDALYPKVTSPGGNLNRKSRRPVNRTPRAISTQRGPQIVDQVVRILEPDRQPDRAGADADAQLVLFRHLGMGGRRRMGDQGLG